MKETVAQQSKWKRVLGESPLPWFLPLIIILLTVFIYPIIEIARLSFTDTTLLSTDFNYTLDSYASLFTDPNFMNMLWITGIFVFFSVALQIILGFIVALLIDQGAKRGLKFTVVTRTAVLSAWAIPGVIIGIIWSFLYLETDAGILNYMFQLLPWVENSIPFLSDPQIALASVIVANVWRGTAFSMIFVYAGLQTFPNDVLEAAKIDGAGAWKRLFKVVIPILSPILLVNTIIITVQTFNTFDMVMALTGGGPGQSTEVIALSIYNSVFKNFDLAQGSAMAMVLLAANLILTAVYFKFVEKK